MSAVVLIVGSSMADAVGGICRSYKDTFVRLGYDFIEINLPNKEEAFQKLNALIGTEIAFAFSFMAMGTDIMVDVEGGTKMPMWDVLRVPYISLYGDSPAYYFDRHVVPNAGYATLYGFPEHLEFRKRFPNINGPISSYSPVAIDVIDTQQVDFTKKQSGPIIMLKNGNDPNKLRATWMSALSGKINSILNDLADELVARINDKATNQIDDLVLRYFADRNIDATAFAKLRLFLVAQLDDYFRRVKSTMVVESLFDFPILLNGYNWDHIDFTGKRLRYVPGGNYVVSQGLIRDCLAMIDMSPNTGRAPHDRPLRAIGAHTLCLTNEQEFFTKELPLTENYFYRFDKDSIQACVADVIGNPARAIETGITVADAFLQKFPPEVFAHQVLELAALMRFNQLNGLPQGMPNYFSWPPTKL